jgi:amino-acid N-acetyltransferase
MSITIRQANDSDVEPILDLVNELAARDLMLPRTQGQILAALPQFLVAVHGGRVVGCGSLVQLTPTLTELRSLAVAPDMQGHGLGGRLVHALVERAQEAGYDQICALTLREPFFNRLGFATVDRWSLSAKIWQECVFCPKFHACDETAVLMNLTVPEPARPHRRWPDLWPGVWRKGLARLVRSVVLARG